MQPKPQSPRPKTGPSLPDLKRQKAQADTTAGKQPKPKSKGPAPVLTPEELAKQKAEKAEQEKKEQEKIKAITDEWKKELTPAEQDEALKAIERMAPGTVVNGVVQPCSSKKKAKTLRCVDPSSPATFSKELKDAIKKNVGGTGKNAKTILVDYDQVAKWEGGNFSGGYVPWGPEVKKVTTDIGEKGKPHKVDIMVPSTAHDKTKDGKNGMLKGWKVGKYGNSSGVTAGVGVDLGAKSEKDFLAELKKSAKESGLMTEAEVDAMNTKLKPYYGKKRTDACQTLRKTPLLLSQKETDLLNYTSFSTHTKEAIRQYENSGEKWNDLSEQEQTLVLSTVYHKGNIKSPKSKAIGSHDPAEVNPTIKGEREKGYMDKYYKEQTAAKAKAEKAKAPKSGVPGSTTSSPVSTTTPPK